MMLKCIMNVFLLFVFGVVVSVSTEDANQLLEEFAVDRIGYTNNLYKEVAKAHSGNFLISPLSIQTIFALVNVGAKGNTSKEIAYSLHLPAEDKIKETFFQLYKSLQSTSNTLNNVNNAYISNDFHIKTQFQKDSMEVFYCKIAGVNFSNTEEAMTLINKWVEIQTTAKIIHLVDETDFNSSTKVVLINALYFQAKWEKQFGNVITKPFHINKSTTVNTKMMAISDDFNFYESPELNATFVELPYKGNEITMTFVVPNEIEGLETLEDKIAEVLVAPKYNKTVRTNVYIPKFKLESVTRLVPILRALGITEAFSSGADFSGVADNEGFVISDAIQKAVIELDEKGTIPAAASAVVFARTGRSNEFYFTADRPFLFYLKHKINGVLFIGRYCVPVNQPDTDGS